MIPTTQQHVDLLSYIFAMTYQTGTVAYGGNKPADHDRFCTQAVLDQIKVRVNLLGLGDCTATPYRDTHRALVFDLCGDRFNVFTVADDEIELIGLTTKTVTAAYQMFPAAGAQKALRIHLFRTLRDTLTLWKRMAIVEDVAEDEQARKVSETGANAESERPLPAGDKP